DVAPRRIEVLANRSRDDADRWSSGESDDHPSGASRDGLGCQLEGPRAKIGDPKDGDVALGIEQDDGRGPPFAPVYDRLVLSAGDDMRVRHDVIGGDREPRPLIQEALAASIAETLHGAGEPHGRRG